MKAALIAFLYAKVAAMLTYVLMLQYLREDVAFALSKPISLGVFILVYRDQSRGQWPGIDLGYKPVHAFAWPVWVLIAIVFGLVARLGAEGLYVLAHSLFDPQAATMYLTDLQNSEVAGAGLDLIAIAVLIVGAIEEELLYRGFLLKSFAETRGMVFAVIFSGLIFGLIHINTVAFIGGIALSILVLASGRLWPAMIAHAVANMVHPMLGDIHDGMSLSVFLTGYSLSACALIAILLFWSIRICRSRPQTRM